MPGILHPALLAHLRQPQAEIHWLFELDLPGGTLRLSMTGVASRTLGNYPPWIKSVSDLNRKLSTWRGGIEAPTLSVEIEDIGGRFTLAYGRNHRGRTARCKLVGPDTLPPETHFTYFVGVVDAVGKSGNTITMELRMRDDQLAAEVPRSVIRGNVFTSLPADTDLSGQAIPYLVGNHDSTDLDARGMVACRYVGSPGSGRFQYLVAAGWWLTVVRVFSDGVEVATPGDYEIVQAITGDSRRVTLLEFVADQETKEILADVQDLDSPAGPCAVLRQVLADTAYGDARAAHLDPTTAPVDAASCAALDTFLVGALGLGRSYELPLSRRAAGDMLKEFCTSCDASCFWGYDGKLRVIPWELRAQNDKLHIGPGADDATLAMRQPIARSAYLSEPSFSVDAESAITRVLGKSGRRAADGSWLNSRSVVLELDASMDRARDAELPWLPASAESVGNLEHMLAESSSSVASFTAVGAASIEAAVSQGPPPGPASNAIHALSDDAGGLGGGTARFALTLSNVPDFVAASALTLWLTYRAQNATSGDEDELNAALSLSGTPYYGTPIVGASTGQRRTAVAVFPFSPDTSLPFTRTELNDAVMLVEWTPGAGAGAIDPNKRMRVLQAWATLTYTAAANVSPALLAILSRAANRYRQPPEHMSVTAPLPLLDYELGDDVPLVDEREGWGSRPWSCGRGRVVGITVGPGVGGVGLELENVRDQLTSLWLLGRATAGVDGKSAAGDGMALITTGATVSVTRASPKCLDSPAGIGTQPAGPVVRILDNCWPSERRGTLVERKRYQELARSSFKAGLTGLTTSAGSGTIEIDKTIGEQLFVDSDVTDGHLLITAGATHSTESRVTWPTTGNVGLGSDHSVVSIDYRCSTDAAGDGPAWRLQRVSDSFYWNDSTGAWQSGAIDNPLSAALAWTRSESKPVTIASGVSRTYMLSVSIPSGGTGSRQIRIGHVQFESSHDSAHGSAQWRSSRIVTDATAGVVREADQIGIDNDKDDGDTLAHTLPNVRGTVWSHVCLNWSSANVTAGTVLTHDCLIYDGNNYWSLAFVAGTGWRWRATSAGLDVDAVVDVPVEAGVEYEIARRWTSELGEWDKPLTMTLIVRVSDGVELGRAEVAYTAPVFSAGAVVGIGHDTSVAGRQLDGAFIEIRESPFAVSDAELDTPRFTATGD